MKRSPRIFEGFEIWWHEKQMQVKFLLVCSLIFFTVWLAIYSLWTLISFSEEERINLLAYLKAEACTVSTFCPTKKIPFLWDGKWVFAQAYEISSTWREYYWRRFTRGLMEFLFSYFFLNLLVLSLGAVYFHRRSKRDFHEEKVLRGQGLIEPKELNHLAKKRYGKGRISLAGNLKFPRKLETRHVFIVGATGTGKTVFLSRQLERLKKDREKGVVLDIKGDYVSRFYELDQDLILNPLDARSISWQPVVELEMPTQAVDFARSFIPPAEGADGIEKYFRDAAKDVLAGIFRVARAKNITENQALWRIISSGPVGIKEFLEEHPLGKIGLGHLAKTDSNQAAGIQSTLMQFCRVFEFMRDKGTSVSLRKWIRTDGPGILFLPIPPDKRELLAPLVASVIDLLIREVLSMPDDLDRRRFFLVDELGAIQKLSTLVEGLTLGRSKGLSIWVGVQDFGKIDTLYGRSIRETLWNNCVTRVILRTVAPDTTEYLSRAVGEVEVEESRRTFGMGVEDVRDGLTYSRFSKLKRIILPVEIQELPDLTAVIKIAEFPPARTEIPFKGYDTKNEPFLPLEETFEAKEEKPTSSEEDAKASPEKRKTSEKKEAEPQKIKGERKFY